MTAMSHSLPMSGAFSGVLETHPQLDLMQPKPEVELQVIIPGIYSSEDPIFGQTVTLKAQRLHTSKYLEKEYIAPEDLDEDNLYTDYADRSTYFLMDTGEKVATVRQIACDKKEGLLSLPTVQNFELDIEAVKSAAGVKKLADIKPAEAVEVSALAAEGKHGQIVRDNETDAVLMLYSRMLRASMEKGQRYWMLNTVSGVVNRLTRVVGEDHIHQIGQPRHYLGSETTPYLVKPQDIVRSLLMNEDPKMEWRKDYLRNVFNGLNAKKVPKDIQALFEENNIETTTSPKWRKIIVNPKIIATAGLAAYCAVRAVPAAEIDGFHGDVEALWSIDFATIYPYVQGLEMAYRGATLGKRVLGLAEASAAFAAPYAYLYAEGTNYPNYINVAIGSVAAVGIAKEVTMHHLKNHREKTLVQGFVGLPDSKSD
ncbi:MAG TPA: hypothetical protein VJR27_00375 [Candidatus Saccharimonadales bacterium]|nr:hypothetical protein [Candidatus Saccharimonadales bacterium]